MSQVSRPMQIVLAVAVLFAAVWFVALRPKPASDAAPIAQQAPTAPGVKGLGNAVAKAHQAVDTANGAAQQAAGTGAKATPSTGGASAATPTSKSAHTTAPVRSSHHAARTHHVARTHHAARRHHAVRSHPHHRHTTLAGVRLVNRALRQHKAIAIAFLNPTVADARAVGVEIRHVSHFGGRAVVLSAPISQLSRYDAITRNVQVTAAPTTIIVAPNGDATTIVGFTDRNEIDQRLADVLPKPKHKHKRR